MGLYNNSCYNVNNTGWWLTYPSEQYDFVSWYDDIPNIWKRMFQTTNQYNFVSIL